MSWLRRLFARERMEAELDKELRFHFESQVADKVRSGIPESEARRLTRLEFGGMEQIKENAANAAEPCGWNLCCRTCTMGCDSCAMHRDSRLSPC